MSGSAPKVTPSERHQRYRAISRKGRAGESDTGSLISLPDRVPRSQKSTGRTSSGKQRRESVDNRVGPERPSPTDRRLSPGGQQSSFINVRGHAAPTKGSQQDVRQREAGGPAPTYKPSPKCSTGGEAAVDGIPLQPGMTNYSNTRSVHSDASVGNPKLSRHYERGTSHPEIHFSSNISVASGTPSFMRIRIGGDDGTSVASGSTTDTSSAAGQQ